MLYAPPDTRLGLWDTWLFKQDDTYHLFHLQRDRHALGCTAIGHAATRDWLHWDTLPIALEQGTGASWDAGPLMTGMTFAHDGRYYMLYGAMMDQVQRIGLAVSDDLITWDKVGRDPILEPAGPWYETDPTQAINYETAWRDPFVFYDEDDVCHYAFICARVPANDDVGGGCIAVARSTNLLDWTLLPPAYVSPSETCLEVPEYFKLQGRHYLTYTTSYHFGTPYPVGSPFQTTGTFYLVSDEMLSGYAPPTQSNALNAGLPHRITSYVGRSIPDHTHPARRLYYYHHVYPPRPGESLYGSLSAPKYIQPDADGHLALSYIPEVLERPNEAPHCIDTPLTPDVLVNLVHDDAQDGIFEATVSAPYAGICFRMGPGREETLEGLAVWLAPASQQSDDLWVLLGTVLFSDGPWGHRPAMGQPAALQKLKHRKHQPGSHHLRVVCRGPFVDVYVDDLLYLTHTYARDTIPTAGGAGAFYAGHPKENAVKNLCVRRLPN